jgi:hypothetical protein
MRWRMCVKEMQSFQTRLGWLLYTPLVSMYIFCIHKWFCNSDTLLNIIANNIPWLIKYVVFLFVLCELKLAPEVENKNILLPELRVVRHFFFVNVKVVKVFKSNCTKSFFLFTHKSAWIEIFLVLLRLWTKKSYLFISLTFSLHGHCIVLWTVDHNLR